MGILVTGASRGIGRAIARAFAEKGDRVAVHYASKREDAERTLGELPGSGHGLVQGDLADPEVARRVADEAEALVDGVDVLVNNAAFAPSASSAHPVAEVSYEDWQRVWRRMLDVNVLGTANVTYCVARHMIERGAPGRVVNIGSRGAFKGEPEFPAYGASKAALHSLGQSLAVALAPHGIAVTTVAPGFTATDRVAAKVEGARGESPFGRVGTPEEVAAAVLYLASGDAAWASGAILDLNGASYLRM
ncbi:SDR family NAD(P)-dependent oxidoreductase [Amycolatopsis roodepoortensis]|uniref:NAD(P)-dependent dehydrogenase (Short-subunit alcohol dehydrogenase family) n=1 Tax=Amycolatopsis roodepoortensis TaxID=700274 RepID=A0ABR9LFF8_9PSEU|nr:SDR family oxidoreductase [Amycolatopsis roodepoortensis]MBE1579025.1 NAD(P)-dependent dehydrogenase (short-subunit alcohol dehydrogenase family) [Amycolatopsis roodepoortensis]